MTPDEAFAGRLLEGETLLWSGRPRQGWRLAAGPLVLAPVLLFEVTRVLFPSSGVPGSPGGAVIALIFAIWFLSGPIRRDARLRAATWYAVTDCRILILRTGRWSGFRAFLRPELTHVALRETTGGRGTIDFGLPPGDAGAFPLSLRQLRRTWLPARFVAIDRARDVFELIERWRAGFSAAAPADPRQPAAGAG